MKRQLAFILKVVLILMLAGCAEASPTPTSQPAVVQPDPTLTASLPPPTVAPTNAPLPSIIPAPATSPLPTPTSLPPTSTSVPFPTSSHTPIPLSTATSPAALAATACSVLPEGGFLTLWQSQPELQAALGCPFEPHPRQPPAAWPVQTSYQPFERGALIWSDHLGWYAQPVIYALYEDDTYQRFDDTFDPATDPAGGEQAGSGQLAPALGFGKVWREQPAVQERLGWPTAPEQSGEGYFQMFNDGEMLWLSQTNRTYVFLAEAGEVKVFEIPFNPEEN